MSIYLHLFLASVFWGSNVIVMKLLLHHVPFLFLATLRVFFSLVFLTLYLKIKDISFTYNHKTKALILGILAIYLNFYFTFLGMNKVKGIDNAFMNALAPVLTFLVSIVLLKQKGHLKDYIAMLVSVFAFLLSIRFQIFSIEIGFWYLFIGMFLYMFANVLIQKWNLHNSLILIFYELFFGFVFLCIHSFVKLDFSLEFLSEVTLLQWFLLLFVSGIGFAYIQVIYMKSIGMIGALKTSFFLSLNPMITYIESLLFLREKFDIFHFIGFILVGLSIYIINGQKEKEIISLSHNNE